MSNEAITWAFRQQLPSTDKFVLIALADYADEELSCFPSHKKTAERVGASVATVKRAIARLTEGDYIRVEKRNRNDGSITSNRYVINVARQDPPVHSDPRVKMNPPQVTVTRPQVIAMTRPQVTSDPTPGHSYDLAEPALIPELTPSEPGGAADADAGDGIEDAEAIEDALDIAVEEKPVWDVIAKRAYDSTDGALAYMGTRGIAKWAVEKKGRTPQDVEAAIASLWRAGRAMTKQSVGQVLDGIVDPSRQGPKSATERRVERNAQVADEWLAKYDDSPEPRNFLEIGQ